MTPECQNALEQQRKMLYIPDTMSRWPWPRMMNPHYEEVHAESRAWASQFSSFTGTRSDWQDVLDKSDLGLLNGLAYPTVSREQLRIAVDFTHVFFVIDDHADVQGGATAREMIDIMFDVLRDPNKPRPDGEIPLGGAMKELWQRTLKVATPSSVKHFIEAFKDCVESMVIQAKQRDNDGAVLWQTLDEFICYRKENIGTRPACFAGELHLTIPDEAFYHPIVKELEYLMAEMVFIDNDMVSYNKEQASGDAQWNILTVAMRLLNVDINEAMVWAHKRHDELKRRFIALLGQVPSFGPEVDKQLYEYISHVANWVRANACWSFEGRRYLGEKGLEVRQTRLLEMLPQVNAREA